MKKNWKETLKLWLGALLLLAESAAIGCKKLPKKAVALCVAAALVVAMVPAYIFAAETTYDIWVGGVQITSANLTVNGDTGTATYDPESEILTLNGFSYTGQGYVYDSLWCAAIFAKNDLTVKIVGSNTVTASVTGSYTAEALNVWGALTITGDSGSSLTLTGAGRDGVGCGGNLKIENVTVNATGTSGLSSDEGITINNAIVNAVGNGDNAIYSTEAVSITNSSVTATAPSGDGIFIYNSYQNLTINNSMLTASVKSNGINVSMGSVHVTNSFIDITTTDGFAIESRSGGGQKAISPYFTDGSDNYVVYAGDDAGSATEADASADATYANKYVKIEPVCTVTVNYGVDGVDNKEITVTKGDTISLENPVIDGYLFMGWFTDTTYQTAFDFTNPITANTTIYAKFADYEGDKTELNNKIDAAKSDLQAKIDAVNSALAGKADAATVNAAIAELQTAITALETAKNNYVGADDALRTELEGKIADAQTAAISAAETLVNNAKTELQSKIDAKADAATTTVAIQNLQAAVAALEAVKDDYATADAALKTELEDKISAAQTAAISAAETLVNNAKTELQSKIDAKADAATTTAAIQNLQAAVAALESVKDDYATADAALKTELEGKISAAQTAAISAAETLVNNAKAELTAAINNKADTATLNAKISELNTAIATAEATAKAYTDDAAAALTTAIATAKSEAISAAETLVNNAKSELQSAIDTKADAATVNAAIANLQNAITALQNAKDNYIAADAALKAELEEKIAKAKQEAIDAAKGHIPYIGTNGNWWIGDTDTGVKAVAEQTAQKGTDTITVVSIVVASVALLSNLALVVWIVTKKKKVLV